MEIVVKTFAIGIYETNCYVVYDKHSRWGVVIDAPDGIASVLQYIRGQELSIGHILLTHGHFDHIGGLDALRRATGAAVAIHEADAYMLDSAGGCLGSGIPGYKHPSAKADLYVTDGQRLSAGNLDIQVYHVPGHTAGDTAYQIGNHLFTGDTLFEQSIGRTDLPGGNLQQLLASIGRLIALEDCAVYPGHGPATTLERERKYNPHLQGNFEERYDDLY